MVFPVNEEYGDGANFRDSVTGARNRRHVMATRTPSPSDRTILISGQRFTWDLYHFRLILKFRFPRPRVNAFARNFSTNSYAASIRAGHGSPIDHRVLFPIGTVFVRCLLKIQTAMLRRRGQVFFQLIRVSQLRSPYVRFVVKDYARFSGLFLNV